MWQRGHRSPKHLGEFPRKTDTTGLGCTELRVRSCYNLAPFLKFPACAPLPSSFNSVLKVPSTSGQTSRLGPSIPKSDKGSLRPSGGVGWGRGVGGMKGETLFRNRSGWRRGSSVVGAWAFGGRAGERGKASRPHARAETGRAAQGCPCLLLPCSLHPQPRAALP